MLHPCVISSCKVKVVTPKLMCQYHWQRVPMDLKERIVEEYTPGQYLDTNRTGSRAWFNVVLDAVRYVKENSR